MRATRDLSSEALAGAFRRIRGETRRLIEPLSPEDCAIQTMPDVSPTRWHLAHTTWFFETFVLGHADARYRPFDPSYAYLFNSYYDTVGAQYPRSERGMLTRPGLADVLTYRRVVEERVEQLLEGLDPERDAELLARTELGLQHEQQHQELILTDILHVLAQSPLEPAYRASERAPGPDATAPLRWRSYPEGLVEIGVAPDDPGFCFDNERPRHRVFLHAFELASRLVTNGELRAFVEDGGYDRPELWLADGWALAQEGGWRAPLYWREHDGGWHEFSLAGREPLEPSRPACHLSYYEADAYARWAGARLPTEAEWETAATRDAAEPLEQRFGVRWQWTQSAYTAYPGYRPPQGALGEYNGKFMCSQQVLRGSSCATQPEQARATARNFFYPHQRWQFTGLRLARDA